MTRKTKSAILEAVHEIATGLHQAGVMDQVTLCELDRLYLSAIEPLARPANQANPRNFAVSQAVFAALLNTSLSTVQK